MLTKDSLPTVGLTVSGLSLIPQSYMTVLYQKNQNLTPSQRKPILLNQRLAHSNFQWNQEICRIPRNDNQKQILRPKQRNTANSCTPLYAAFTISKQITISPLRNSTKILHHFC